MERCTNLHSIYKYFDKNFNLKNSLLQIFLVKISVFANMFVSSTSVKTRQAQKVVNILLCSTVRYGAVVEKHAFHNFYFFTSKEEDSLASPMRAKGI